MTADVYGTIQIVGCTIMAHAQDYPIAGSTGWIALFTKLKSNFKGS